jgi:hypothetical protein
MSLLPNFIGADKRKDEPAPADTPAEGPRTEATREAADDPIFNLLPPGDAQSASDDLPKPQGRNRHPVEMTDLSRLSIDRDGRLYWDGKPVEVHRRIAMSRRQVIAASIVAAFVAIGAIGAALQGTLAARELMCRLGWSASACAMPMAPRAGSDIPA